MGNKQAASETASAGPADTTSAATAPTTTAAGGQAPERKPMPEPEGGWPADEFTGRFGYYIRDPFTGVRSINPNAPKYEGSAS